MIREALGILAAMLVIIALLVGTTFITSPIWIVVIGVLFGTTAWGLS